MVRGVGLGVGVVLQHFCSENNFFPSINVRNTEKKCLVEI